MSSNVGVLWLWQTTTYLAVCCFRAIKNVLGWNNSLRSIFAESLSTEVFIFFTAVALATTLLMYVVGSFGPSHRSIQNFGVLTNRKNNDAKHTLSLYFIWFHLGNLYPYKRREIEGRTLTLSLLFNCCFDLFLKFELCNRINTNRFLVIGLT